MAPLPARPPAATGHPAAHAAPAKPTSTPESRSAAALALSHEPTYDEGTAKRIKEAALSYSDLAVRGGWPVIPTEAKFAPGTQGAHDDLLRKRLIITEDLAGDKAFGPYDDSARRSREAIPGAARPRRHRRHDAADADRAQRLRAEAHPAAGSLARTPRPYGFQVRRAVRRGQHSRDLRGSHRKRQGCTTLSCHRRQDRKAVADADRRNHQRQSQSDMDRAVLDFENRNLGAYAQGPRLSVAHAYGSARRAGQSDRSAFGGLVRQPHAEFHRAPAVRRLERARRGEDRHAQSLFGLHARHQPAQPVRGRLSLRFARLLARRQCPRPCRLALEGPAEMDAARKSIVSSPAARAKTCI